MKGVGHTVKIFSGEYYVYDPNRVVPEGPEIYMDVNHRVVDNRPADKKVKGEVFVEMPFIKGTGEKPVVVTEDWYVKKEKKRRAKKSRDRRDIRMEMIDLLTKRDRIVHKLSQLDPTKKKNSKKIRKLNALVRDIDAQLTMLSSQGGIPIEELERGSKLQRTWRHVKKFFKKQAKKAKRWLRDNSETVAIVGSVVLPIFGSLIIKLVTA